MTAAGGRQPVPPGVAADLAAVRLVVFDFDGVFTDNTVYVSEDGTESVRCWRGDGLGLQAVQRLGLQVLILSTEVNPVVTARCRKLRVECVQGCEDKRARLEALVRDRGLTMDQVAYVGNDVNDLGCLEAVRVPVVVGRRAPVRARPSPASGPSVRAGAAPFARSATCWSPSTPARPSPAGAAS